MSNLLLSSELLSLMGWLLKNEKTRMRGLIKQALDNGLSLELINLSKDEQSDENLQNTFVDFMSYLENTLLNGLDDVEIEQDFLTSMNKLNINNVDTETLLASAQEAEGEYQNNIDKKKLLLEKVLKNWEPSADEVN